VDVDADVDVDVNENANVTWVVLASRLNACPEMDDRWRCPAPQAYA